MDNQTNILDIVKSLHNDGRTHDAMAICNYVISAHPRDLDANCVLADLLSASDKPEEALVRLVDIKQALPPSTQLNTLISQHAYKAVLKYNVLLSSGKTEEAAKVIYTIARARPTQHALTHALNISRHLCHAEQVIEFSRCLLLIDPVNSHARSAIVGALQYQKKAAEELESRLFLTFLGQTDIFSIINNISQLLYLLMVKFPQSFNPELLDTLVERANYCWDKAQLPVDNPYYEKTRFTLAHIRKTDAKTMPDHLPPQDAWPAIGFAKSSGTLTDLESVKQTVIDIQAQAIIFVAADSLYIERFGGIFLKWFRKHCDTPCLIIMHVIGGIDSIGQIAESVGIDDPALVYSGCGFDKEKYASLSAISSAGDVPGTRPYYQSARYIWLGFILEQFRLPTLVSDIDMLLQRGIKDLIDSNSGNDTVFRRSGDYIFGHFAANLLLVNPTDSSISFARYLRYYLEKTLLSEGVPIGIDQLSLLLAHTYMSRTGNPRFAEFSQEDNNNILTTNYRPNQYRFFSLHSWFDTSVIPEP